MNHSTASTYKCFLSFGDSRMSHARNRIAKQARDMNFFDEILVWDENDLDEDFRKKWSAVLNSNTRGFGYWVWKPYSILKALERIPENATLLYLDAGCHFNQRGKKRLIKYYDELMGDPLGVKAFPVNMIRHEMCMERRWTKGDLFDFFTCRQNKYITDTAQLETGHIMIRKCPASIKLLEEWYKTYECNYSLVTDEPSKSSNFPDFVENRHDQSVFSLLFKLNKGIPFKQGGTIPDIISNPIWSRRDRWGNSKSFRQRISFFIKHYAQYFILILQRFANTLFRK